MIISGNGLVEEEKKPNNFKKWILKSIIILAILCVILIIAALIIDANTRKIYVDGRLIKPTEDVFIINEDDGSIYISIKDIDDYIEGYGAYNGDYYQKSENTNQSYIKSANEITLYTFNTNVIYKTPLSNQPDYSTFTIQENIKKIGDKLYTTPEGIELGYNITFSYDKEKDEIKIFTLKYLNDYYNQIVKSKGYSGLSTNFENQKAILYDLLVVSKQKLNAEKEEDVEYGVITTRGTAKMDVKYDELKFIETTQDFLITSLEKVGLSTNSGITKINPMYDELKLLDKDSKLYLAKSNNSYGVIDDDGNIIIHLEYNKIGVDSSLYPSNDIMNSMFFFDNCIIAERDQKINIFDKHGNLLVPSLFYDGCGCVVGTSKNISANNLLIIPEYEYFILYRINEDDRSRTKKYGIVNSVGEQIVACEFDKIYSVTTAGNDEYYLEYNGQKITLDNYLIQLNNQSNTQQEEEIIENVNTNNEETRQEENNEQTQTTYNQEEITQQ